MFVEVAVVSDFIECQFCATDFNLTPALFGFRPGGQLDLIFVCSSEECREELPSPFVFTSMEYISNGT